MKKRLIRALAVTAMASVLYSGSGIVNLNGYETEKPVCGVFDEITPHYSEIIEKHANSASRVALEAPKTAQIGVLGNSMDENTSIELEVADGELELIALICAAEAGNQSELGKRLVIDSVLNRIDSESFPDSATEVIFQNGQYNSAYNGAIDKVELTEEICDLVMEELEDRTNEEVIFFCTGDYFEWAEPVMQEGDHYFSN